MIQAAVWLMVASLVAGATAGDGGPPGLGDHVAGIGPSAAEVSSQRTLTIAFTGDTLVHLPLAARARSGDGYDFRSMFDPVRPILETADLAICHLEVPLSPDNEDLSGYPLFSAPHELAEGLAYAGFDGCSTASNHSYDRGEGGVRETIEALEDSGIRQSGMAASAGEAWRATVYEVRGLTIAHISATYWLNGLRMPEARQWLVQLLDRGQILGIASQAKRAGADLVVVSAHCCVEYRQEPTPVQRELYEEMIRSDNVDLVVGHHSHVIGPIENVGGEFIVYGLGNFLSLQRQTPELADGMIAMVEVARTGDRWRIAHIEVVPTWVERGSYRILPAVVRNPDSYRRTMRAVNLGRGGEIGPFPWVGQPGRRLPESY